MSSFQIGVCSWSLQVTSIPELEKLCQDLNVNLVQLALGDPHHATWEEGDGMIQKAKETPLEISATMMGFPGEDYTTPKTIEETGGFGDPKTRDERIELFKWGVQNTAELGRAQIITTHAGFIPEPGEAGRKELLDCLGLAASIAKEKNQILALETGQETADLLRLTLDELGCENLKVNFDPANMILYDKGDPIRAIEILGPDIAHVHAKDAKYPLEKGNWGEEVPLGEGQVGMESFLKALIQAGYTGPIAIEREVGDQAGRIKDIQAGVETLAQVQSNLS